MLEDSLVFKMSVLIFHISELLKKLRIELTENSDIGNIENRTIRTYVLIVPLLFITFNINDSNI
jgi:hypothetical protein